MNDIVNEQTNISTGTPQEGQPQEQEKETQKQRQELQQKLQQAEQMKLMLVRRLEAEMQQQ
jgi:hypothetical protein